MWRRSTPSYPFDPHGVAGCRTLKNPRVSFHRILGNGGAILPTRLSHTRREESSGAALFFQHGVGSSRNLLKDSDGAEFSDLNEARKEAIGLARDVARHGVQGSAIWQVVVTDESGRDVLTIPLSEIRASRITSRLDLGRTVAHIEARLGARTF